MLGLQRVIDYNPLSDYWNKSSFKTAESRNETYSVLRIQRRLSFCGANATPS